MGCNAERQRIHSSYKQFPVDSPSVSQDRSTCMHIFIYSHCNNDLVWINNGALSVIIIRYAVMLTERNVMDS